ncbi:nitrate- and nitrite sensing domain-containing protein [Pseudomonadota bacterium]
MERFFKPAAAVMNRFRFSTKFLIIFTVILVQLVALNLIIISTFNQKITTLEHEQQGLTFIESVRPLLEHMPQHRGLTNVYLNGDKKVEQKISNKRDEIDAALVVLKTQSYELDLVLQSSQRVASIQDQWSNLKRGALKMSAAESFSAHTRMISSVIELMGHAANTSEMILSGEPVTVHLTDAVINRLPVVIESMGQARGLGAGGASKGELSQQQAIRLAVLVDRIHANDVALEKGMEIAIAAGGEQNHAPLAQ